MRCSGVWRWIGAVSVAAALLAGCGDDDGLGPVEHAPPDQAGPFPVGVTEVAIDDGQGTGRELPIVIWYPANPGGEAEPYVYEVSLEALVLASLDSPQGALADPPADPRGPFPVVIFSHGNGGLNIQSFYMTEWLASHGFIVAAPDHVGNTVIDEVRGSAIPTAEAAVLRPTDVSRTLDAVFRENDDPASPIAGAASDVSIGVAGHSFGGFTTFRVTGATIDQALLEQECATGDNLLCDSLDTLTIPESQRDDRFIAGLPQAPGGAEAILPGMGYADVAVPTMVQAGDADITTPYLEESVAPFEQLTVESWLMVLGDAGHFTFSDMCRVLGVLDPGLAAEFGDVLNDGCGDANLDWMRAHEVINAYSTDFFQFHLTEREGYGDRLSPDFSHPPEVVELRVQ